MSVEELMQVRYKVIADYPLSHMYFNVGDILTWNGEYFRSGENIKMSATTVTSFPHLFKPLEWFEDRKLEDMPDYIKIPHYPNGEKDFIIEHIDGDFIKHDFTTIGYFGLRYKNGGGLIAGHFTPATKEDFLNYQNQNTNDNR